MTHPSRAQAHHILGAELLANEEYKKALIELNKAISIDPLDANFRHTRAWALWRLKQSQQALDELKFAINLSAEPALLESLGSFMFMLGDYDQALRIYSKAISKAASAHEAAAYLRKRGATFLALGQDEFALLDLNKAIEIEPSEAQNYAHRAEVYEQRGRIDDAICDYTRALDAFQENGHANSHDNSHENGHVRVRRGECYFEQDRLAPALEDAQVALRLDEKNSEAHMLMGKVLFEEGQVSIAMQFFYTAFTFDPDCAWGYLRLALCFDLLEQRKEAHHFARKAAATDAALKKYTLEETRRLLISERARTRLQSFVASIQPIYPELSPEQEEIDFTPY